MQLFGRAVSPIYNVYIRRTNHVTFSDLGLIIRIPDSSLMDIRKAHGIINAYTIAFFNRYLNDASSALVDGVTPSRYETSRSRRGMSVQSVDWPGISPEWSCVAQTP